MSDGATLLIANGCDATRTLARALEADVEGLPDLKDVVGLERWRERQAEATSYIRVAVAVWPESTEPRPLVAQVEDEWRARMETSWIAWNVALGGAARRVADGGAIVAILQAPAALDARGRVPETSIADGVIALARSLAVSEGTRRVRANVVATPIGVVPDSLTLPSPPLPSFPGALENEVAGAVRLLLSQDASGVTGRVLPADCGRFQ